MRQLGGDDVPPTRVLIHTVDTCNGHGGFVRDRQGPAMSGKAPFNAPLTLVVKDAMSGCLRSAHENAPGLSNRAGGVLHSMPLFVIITGLHIIIKVTVAGGDAPKTTR